MLAMYIDLSYERPCASTVDSVIDWYAPGG